MRNLTIFFIIYVCAISAYAETAQIITREAAVREQCKFLSPIKIIAHYNDSVELTSLSGEWIKIRFNGIEGFIHKNTVRKKNISFFTDKTKTEKKTASEYELSLAGKGFNPNVERTFKDKYKELDFSQVDLIEKYNVSERDLEEFIIKGGLFLP